MRKSRGSIKNTKKAFLLFRSFTFQDQILCFLESVFIYFFFLLVFQVFLDSFRYFFILQNEKRNSVFVLNCNLWKRWERNTGLHRRKCEEKSIFNEEEERNFFMRAQSSSCVSVSAWISSQMCLCSISFQIHKMAECFSNSHQWVSPLCVGNIVKQIVYTLAGHEDLHMCVSCVQNWTKGAPNKNLKSLF